MKIENLQIGQILKSYKQLCEVLEELITAGNSKKSQIKEWERHFKYHKEGNKFIIDENYKLVNLLVNTDMVDVRQVVKIQKLNN